MAGQMWTLEQTKIGEAIKQGSITELKNALAEGENVTFQDRKGNTYLHYVCTMYRPYIFNILAASNININAKNKHGNTALHVTALHRECGHVSDLMAYGVDPFIKNKDGKTALELSPKGLFWQSIYGKYQPGIFRAVEDHDVERVRHLLHCWCRADCLRDGQTLRQFAAARKHHDIVLLLDQHRHTSDAIFGVLEVNHDKAMHAINSEKCNINFLNKASELKHILQHALRLKDLRMVQLVCKAGANVNLPINLQNYFKAPLYFAAISPRLPLDIVWTVLKAKPDFLLKDQRGRNAVVFALDKSNRKVPLQVIEYMMQNGVYLADRDMTGITARDVARLARRRDVLEHLNRMYIKLLRQEEMEKLEQLAQDGYDSMLIDFNHRDTYIYACGNETDDVVRFVQHLPTFQSRVRQVREAVKTQPVESIQQLLQEYSAPFMIANSKDKGGRSLLHLCVLHWRTDVMRYLLSLPYLHYNAQDNLFRTAYHYACAMKEEEREDFKAQLQDVGCDTQLVDCSWLTAQDYEDRPDVAMDLDKERNMIYGMDRQLLCVDKYEELRKIIRNKRRSLKDFKTALRNFKYPVTSFARVLGPVVASYRDLVFLAVDSGQLRIAEYLAHLGADLTRKEKYIISDGDELKDDLSSKVSTCSPDLDADRPGLEDGGPSQALSEMSGSSQPSETPRGKRQQGEEEEKEKEEEDVHPTPLEAQQETVNAAVEAALETKTARVAVQYLSVVDRARQLGLDTLVELFERKLEFHRNRQAKGADVDERSENGESEENGESIEDGVSSKDGENRKNGENGEGSENGESDDNGESSDDGDISENGDISEIEYVSDFDSDFVEDL